MKVLKYFKLLNLLFLVSKSVQEETFEKLANFACDVVEELVREKPETKTVSITLWPSWFDKKFFYNSISQCLTQDVAVMSKDFTSPVVNDYVLAADFVILICDQLLWSEFDIAISDSSQRQILNHNAKFLMLTKFSDPCEGWNDLNQPCPLTDHHRTLLTMTQKGIFNFVWVYLKDHEINPIIYDFAIKDTSNQKEKPRDNSLIKVLYPDKLKDQKALNLNVLSFPQTRRVIISEDGNVSSKFNYFLSIVEEKMNIRFKHDTLSASMNNEEGVNELQSQYIEKRNQRSFVLTLIDSYNLLYSAPPLLTYEESSECILVPIPSETLGTELFVKPFDKFVWLTLALTLMLTGVFWRIFPKISSSDSCWHFLFVICCYLIGQGGDIRNHELGLKILVQLIIFMTIILSNSYIGVITSILTGRTDYRLKTFDEVLESDYKLLVGSYHDELLNMLNNYKNAKASGKVYPYFDSLQPNYTTFYEQDLAVMMPCLNAEILVEKGQPAATLYYLLPERLFPSFTTLDAGFINPYIRRIQQIMDECFAAGLHQAWETIFNFQPPPDGQISENFPITLSDVKPVFIIFFVGIVFAFVILVSEIIFDLNLKRKKLYKVSCKDDE